MVYGVVLSEKILLSKKKKKKEEEKNVRRWMELFFQSINPDQYRGRICTATKKPPIIIRITTTATTTANDNNNNNIQCFTETE